MLPSDFDTKEEATVFIDRVKRFSDDRYIYRLYKIMEQTIEDHTYDDIFIFVPAMSQIIRISEGDGMNLQEEDIQNGYTDYIYYDQHELSMNFPGVDGGQVMLKKPFRERFNSMEECVPYVLDMAYGNDELEYVILK